MGLIIGGTNGGGSGLTAEQGATLARIKYNPLTDRVESSRPLGTTLSSLYLGGQHKVSSGGENVFFTNLSSGINWFPAWSGIRDQEIPANQDETGVIPPSFRIPSSDLIFAEFTGAEAFPYAWVESGSSNPAPFNLSLHGVVLRPQLAVPAGVKLRYVIIDDSNGNEIYEQLRVFQTELAAETLFNWWFDHPVETVQGKSYTAQLQKETGPRSDTYAPLMISESVTTGQTYSQLIYRGFEDVDVMTGVTFITVDRAIYHAGTYAVDTSAGGVNLTVNEAVGYKSFTVFDANQSFSVTNPCVVDFGAPQGTATLQTKNDAYLFYNTGTEWRYLDLDTKDGDIV